MSHWFHRNVLKATSVVAFDKLFQTQDINVAKLCRDLKQSRDRLLELLPDHTTEAETLNTAFSAYLSLFHGLIIPVKGSEKTLENAVLFKWTHSLLGQTPEVQQDAIYEIASMCVNVSFWYMKHAAFIASKDDITMDQAKEVHSSLRKAAGIIQYVQKELHPRLKEVKPGGDLDPKVLSAYFNQATAEAQEVTVARAMEMKHNPSLISALANETSKLFKEASKHLAPLDKKIAEQWKLYLNIKSYIYLAYSYNYCGQNLLALDKCGEAIRALKESQKFYEKALELCKPYYKAHGKVKPVKPDEHPFFKKLAPVVKLTLDKCERENGFIYHQKVPELAPELELKATYGLVCPEEFKSPSLAALWSSVTLESAPNVEKKDPQTSKASTKLEGDLPPVKEVTSSPSKKAPKTESGCVLQ